jgi:hypothetical protein
LVNRVRQLIKRRPPGVVETPVSTTTGGLGGPP